MVKWGGGRSGGAKLDAIFYIWFGLIEISEHYLYNIDLAIKPQLD